MSVSLAYLTDAVRGDIGDLSGYFADSVIERFLMEGQRKLEPDHLLEKQATISWADNATSVALPSDYYEMITVVPDSTSYTWPLRYREHGTSLYFDGRDTVYAFSGKLYYRAHYPAFTSTIPCVLPAEAADALISYANYKCYQRVGGNRAEYKRYATLSQNNVTMGDLLAAGNGHLADFNDAKTMTGRPSPPIFYTDQD